MFRSLLRSKSVVQAQWWPMVKPKPLKANWCQAAGFTSSKLDPPLRCTVFDEHGKVIQVAAQIDRKQFIRDYGLHSRDLRHVDSQQSTLIPSILIHKGKVVVSICDLRVLIRQDQVLVFHSRDPKIAERLSMLVYDFSAKLAKKAAGNKPYVPNRDVFHDGRQTYEQTALEIVLTHAMAYLEVELDLMLQSSEKILSELEVKVDRKLLGELLARSRQLHQFHRKCIGVRNALSSALDDVPDLKDMYYSTADSLDATRVDDDGDAENSDVNDIEILLETYYKEADELVQKAGKTVRDVSTTEEVINIMVDANRNSLLLFRLEISVITVGFTIALFFATLYGMNLENFFENHSWGMPLVTGGLIAISILATVYNFRKLRLTEKVFVPSRTQFDSDSMSLWLKQAKHTPNPRTGSSQQATNR